MRAVILIVDVHHVFAERIALQTEDYEMKQFAHLVGKHPQQIIGQHQFTVHRITTQRKKKKFKFRLQRIKITP